MQHMHLRWLTSPNSRLFTGLACLSVFLYTKISHIGIDDDIQTDNTPLHPQLDAMQLPSRSNCQIIYILGVEETIHHGFTPILHSLALKQTDTTGQSAEVRVQPRALRSALFGRFGEKRSIDDPSLITDTIAKLCPDDGKKHILIEDSSFPSGHEGDPRVRYPRQHTWLNMTMNEIASSELALEHPVNLYKFVELYGRYADIKFVVLHRPFLETVSSHQDWDESVLRHSNLIRGFMLILRRFLDHHHLDIVGRQMWTIVCVERLMSQFYQYESDQGVQIDIEAWNAVRQNILAYLADFLGWSQIECSDCFDSWREGSENKEVKTLKVEDNIMPLLDHMKEIEMVWPPPLHQNELQVQQCST